MKSNSKIGPLFLLSEKEIAGAFTEWERRYRKNPERFQSEAEKLLRDTPNTYGEACAPYFLKIASEIKRKRIASKI